MIPKRVLFALLVLALFVAGWNVCTGEPIFMQTGLSSTTLPDYPYKGFQTTFSLDIDPDTAYATIYMLHAPKSEAAFTELAQRFITTTLGKEFSDTLGGTFEGRRLTHVEVVGVYRKEMLVMSRKIGDVKASLEKYDPSSMNYGSFVGNSLPPTLINCKFVRPMSLYR